MSHKTAPTSGAEPISAPHILVGVDPGFPTGEVMNLSDAGTIVAEVITLPSGGKYLRIVTS